MCCLHRGGGRRRALSAPAARDCRAATVRNRTDVDGRLMPPRNRRNRRATVRADPGCPRESQHERLPPLQGVRRTRRRKCSCWRARAAATDVVVYDDALQSGWQDYSYGGGSNFASTAWAHGGSSVHRLHRRRWRWRLQRRVLYHPADYTTAAYPTLHFWVHGGSSGGSSCTCSCRTPTASWRKRRWRHIAGGAIVAGTWKEVTCP